MKRKELLILTITNNTAGTIPASILAQGNPNDSANARTKYEWDISAAVYSPQTLSIQVRAAGVLSFKTITANLLGTNPAGVAATLNSLNIGAFSYVGNTIYTYNDNLVYGNLLIGSPATLSFVSDIQNPGDPFAATLNGSGVLSGTIDYGDGTVTPFSNPLTISFNHAYAAAGTYDVSINIDLPANITEISISNVLSRITSVAGLNNLTGLAVLIINDQQLTSIDVTGNPAVTEIALQNNLLTTLNVTANTALQLLFLSGNQITVIDVTANIALQELGLSNNQLSAIDISQNTALTIFNISGNSISAVDLTTNALLLTVLMSNNTLSVVAVNGALVALDGFGLNNGTFGSNGQTPAAPPSGAGASAKTSLQGKGWIVTTD